MKRPSLQFYPGDWLANSNLRRCTFEERGVWISVICLLHDQEDYGLIRWPIADIAQAVGCPADCLLSLVRKGVLKGSDEYLEDPFVYIPRSGRKDGDPVTLVPEQPGPVWYSSRMVKDEHIRQNRGAATRFGTDGEGQPQPLKTKHSPKPPIGEDIGVHPTFTHVSAHNGDTGSGHAVNSTKNAHLLNIEAESSPKPPIGEGLGVVKGDGSSSSSSSSKNKARKHAPHFNASLIDLPEWLDRSAWTDWVADRKERRKPITERAAQQQLKTLAGYRDEGHAPAQVIAHSIANGYQGLFPPSRKALHAQTEPARPVLHADELFTGGDV